MYYQYQPINLSGCYLAIFLTFVRSVHVMAVVRIFIAVHFFALAERAVADEQVLSQLSQPLLLREFAVEIAQVVQLVMSGGGGAGVVRTDQAQLLGVSALDTMVDVTIRDLFPTLYHSIRRHIHCM